MKYGLTAKPVMPGQSSQACADCVNLSAMPGIHVLLHLSGKDVDGRDKLGIPLALMLVRTQGYCRDLRSSAHPIDLHQSADQRLQ